MGRAWPGQTPRHMVKCLVMLTVICLTHTHTHACIHVYTHPPLSTLPTHCWKTFHFGNRAPEDMNHCVIGLGRYDSMFYSFKGLFSVTTRYDTNIILLKRSLCGQYFDINSLIARTLYKNIYFDLDIWTSQCGVRCCFRNLLPCSFEELESFDFSVFTLNLSLTYICLHVNKSLNEHKKMFSAS